MEEERLRALLDYGWLSLNREDLGAANSAAADALALDMDNSETLYLAGLTALGSKDGERAEWATKHLLNQAPNEPDAHLLLGFYCYDVTKDFTASERAFREALKLAPDDPYLYGHLGQFLAARNRFQEGIATARKGLRIDPDNLLVVKTLHMLYRLADDLEMAEEFGNRALQLDPEDSQNHLHTGFRLLEGKESTKAKGSFLEALRLDPADDDSFQSIAHEKVRNHPFFKDGIFLSFHKWVISWAIVTPIFWWLLSLLWKPFIWVSLLSAIILICGFGYSGLFHLCRRIVLRRLRSGKL